ncbi:MAG: M23 family metallopeptidase [Candidatus Goldbacteria bacterium]|nr:M23 family metallopeptidase [Candidatus Goldiibacteriota bacterium]
MQLKKIFYLIIFIFVTKFCFSFYAILESNIVREGGVLKIKIGNYSELKAADIIFNNQKYPIFFVGYNYREREYVYNTIIPVPLDTKTGKKNLEIKCLFESDEEKYHKERIIIKPLFKEKDKLTRINTKGKIQGDTLSELQRENKIISKFQEKYTTIKYDLPFMMPISEIEPVISSNFGKTRKYDEANISWRHKGIDIAAPAGTKVRAANHGRVVAAYAFKAYGNTVIIDHGGGIYSLYLHMDDVYVRTDDKVFKGDIIGTVGNTGISTGPHLHFQINIFKVPVNPYELM